MASNSEKQINRNSRRSSEHQQATCLERLPHEVYFRILAKLPISSLLECKLVSRSWYSSVKDSMVTRMHLTHNADNNPCLVIFSDWPNCKLQLADLGGAMMSNLETVKVLKMPFESMLSDFEVLGSCNGLICLYNYVQNDPLYIYNPFTIEHRELPRLPTSSDANVSSVVFGFGFHPRTKEYKAVKLISYKIANSHFMGTVPEAFVLRLGSPTWRNIGEIPYRLTGPASEAEVNGKLHWLAAFLQVGDVEYRDIVSFDLETEEFRVVPRPSCGGLNKTNYHLVTLQGCLSAVVSCSDMSNEIWMMKEYNVENSWTKQFTIARHVPESFRWGMAPPFRARKNGHRERHFRVLCDLKNGDILFLYYNRCLGCYNPESGEFKDLNFEELPMEFQATVHVGSLISVDTVFGMQQRE